MSEIIHLERADLEGIFANSLPTAPRLPARECATAIRMLKSGADVPAVALHLRVSIAAVWPLKDYLDAQQRRQDEAAQRDEDKRLAESAANVARVAEIDKRYGPPAHVTVVSPPTAPPPAPAQPSDIAAPLPDIKLGLLQRGAIRLLRLKGVPIEDIARGFRTGPDQIRAVCGETEVRP